MNSGPDQLRDFLDERGVRSLGPSLSTIPTAQDAWRYVARQAVSVTERVAGGDIRELEAAFRRLAGRLSLLDSMPVLLSISGFGGPWVRVELARSPSLVQRLCVIPDEPSFILASGARRVILAVDTEEWDFLLIAARWSDDGSLVSVGVPPPSTR